MGMTIEEFAEELKNELLVGLTETEINITKVMKNNDVELTALIIKEKNCNMAPTIYIDGAYKKYEEGKEMHSIVNEIVNIYKRNKPNTDFDISMFTDFDKVKERITYQLVNANNNTYIKENCITVPYLDMYVIFKVVLENNASGLACVTIKKEHLNLWKGVTETDLIKYSAINTPKILPVNVKTLEETMIELLPMEAREDMEILRNSGMIPEFPEMYVCTNTNKTNGASVIMYKNLLKNLAKELNEQKLYVIPSSIHECIIAKTNDTPENIRELISFVNDTEVSPEEVLSQSLYIYNAITDELSIA